MAKAFSKVAAFTDIHWGNKNNSQVFNQDCIEFVDWFIHEAAEFGAETMIFLGDWFHNRAQVNVSTLNLSLSAMEKLSQAFDHCYYIVGNHDMYYRDRRDINSIEVGRNISNITVVREPMEFGNVLLVPWLVGEEYKTIRRPRVDYVFGHFELPHFYMNAMVKMPDHGNLIGDESFAEQRFVFSGHFHKRQRRNNIIYIGNAFPHNYADADDDHRGCMLLEWGGEPQFLDWSDCPRYRNLLLSDLLDDPSRHLGPKTYARISLDLDISYEEASYLKEHFMTHLHAREIELRPRATDLSEQTFDTGAQIQSIDQLVISGLEQVDNTTIDPRLLVEIYQGLAEDLHAAS